MLGPARLTAPRDRGGLGRFRQPAMALHHPEVIRDAPINLPNNCASPLIGSYLKTDFRSNQRRVSFGTRGRLAGGSTKGIFVRDEHAVERRTARPSSTRRTT
jgi:hypothetical protein